MTQQNGRDVDVPDEDGEGGEASLPGAMGAAVPQRAAVAVRTMASCLTTEATRRHPDRLG